MKRIGMLLVALLTMLSCSMVSAAGHNQTFMFYLDAEGNISYENGAADSIVKAVQSKLPQGDVVVATHEKAWYLDQLRLAKQEELVSMLANYPSYAAINPGSKALMTDRLLQTFLQDRGKYYDGVIIVRIKPMEIKTSTNWLNTLTLGIGGKNTEADMQVSTIVYTKTGATVFNDTQVVRAKIEGTWAPVAVAKRAVPLALAKISQIKTTR